MLASQRCGTAYIKHDERQDRRQVQGASNRRDDAPEEIEIGVAQRAAFDSNCRQSVAWMPADEVPEAPLSVMKKDYSAATDEPTAAHVFSGTHSSKSSSVGVARC